MVEAEQENLKSALAALAEPWLGGALGAAGWPTTWDFVGKKPRVEIELGYPLRRSRAATAERLTSALRSTTGVEVDVELRSVIASHAVQPNLELLSGIRNVLAVASAKGGVGKSTVAVNLALALADEGAQAGLLDADIYGPSQPRMLGLTGRPQSRDGKRLEPLAAFGLKVMSAGFLVDAATPMIWRGPMVTQALTQLLTATNWGRLDYLVVDMPPGTGDIQLTLAQRVPVAGAVVVTTPQEIAVADARKAIGMFRKVEVPVLGIVENMAGFRCPNCGEVTEIFGGGGGMRLAAEAEVGLLGRIPLDPRIQRAADGGRPSVISEPEGENAADYRATALKVAAVLAQRGRGGTPGPEIVIE